MSHSLRRRAIAATTALAITSIALTGCGNADESDPTPHADIQISTAFELPGDNVYPEGIAVDPRSGDTYVGSYRTGAIYRAGPNATVAEMFLPEGADGRTTANGLEVDQEGRLWVTDSTTGVAVYDIATRDLIARFDIPGDEPHFLNDLAITSDGTVYLTDSIRAVVYRVTADQVLDAAANGGQAELTPRFDLGAAIGPREPNSVSLNGIVADPAGRYLLVVDMPRGDLYRVDLAPDIAQPIREVTLHGGDLTNGDGLELRGDTLWVAHNASNTITRWAISDDGATATQEAHITDESLNIPTTLVRTDDQTLVVSSQFNKGGPMGPGTPTTFQVVAVDGI